MSEVATKRKLMEQARLLVNANDATTTIVACAALLDALGALISYWTGEVVRVSMTAEGQPDALDMTKQPGGEIEKLRGVLRDLDVRLRECSNISASAEDAYDSYYQDMVAEALTPNAEVKGAP